MPVESPTRRGRPCPKPMINDVESRERIDRKTKNFLIIRLQLVSGCAERTLMHSGNNGCRGPCDYAGKRKTGGLRKNNASRVGRARKMVTLRLCVKLIFPRIAAKKEIIRS